MDAITPDDVMAAIDRVEWNGNMMRSALEVAAGWEQAVMSRRPEVLRRMLELGSG